MSLKGQIIKLEIKNRVISLKCNQDNKQKKMNQDKLLKMIKFINHNQRYKKSQ